DDRVVLPVEYPCRDVDRGEDVADIHVREDPPELLEAGEPPNFGPPLHIHHGIAEAFYVIEGEYIIFIRDDEFRCPAGSFVFIPAETPHGFRVGDVASRKLNLYLPASMVGYFDDLSDAMKNGEADPERLSAIATRHAVEVIGPVPEGYL
ncbi:MAG: cupin domain-containing protein, partial [Actinomycetota bacterium]|nr:cupin domain-containing protein [Actinomycetota bacterium]